MGLGQLICPHCKTVLKRKRRGYHCPDCDSIYPVYKVGELPIIEFLGLNGSVCSCNRDGLVTHSIDLKKMLKEELRTPKGKPKIEDSAIAENIRVDIGKNSKILDIGCGEGRYGPILSEKNEAYALDGCVFRFLFSNEKGDPDNATNKGYKGLLLGDARELPFEDGAFDVIIATEIVEHIVETRQFINEVNRVLKKGGKLILTTPNLASLGNRLGLLFGKGLKFHPFGPIKGEGFYPRVDWQGKKVNFSCIRYPEQPLHYRFFTFESMRTFLDQTGFDVVKELGIDPRISGAKRGTSSFLRNWTDDMYFLAVKR